MTTEEIELKFLRVDHNDIRSRLSAAGAQLIFPMQLLKRAILDYPDRRLHTSNTTDAGEGGYVRVRTEPDGTIELMHKYFHGGLDKKVSETAVKVADFDQTIAFLESIGLEQGSYQESKREVWHLDDTEVVLDEWPWVDPFIEIEADNIDKVHSTCIKLGLDIRRSAEGSANNVYKDKYPKMTDHNNIGDIPEVKFDLPVPKYLVELL